MRWGRFIGAIAGVFYLTVPAAHSANLPEPALKCLVAGRAAARGIGAPPELMSAITLVETGRRREGKTMPWPWTINVEGKGYWFATKAEAIAFVRKSRKQGARSIDVGCYQINLRWHPGAFRSLEDAFDPLINATYAAKFLNTLKTPNAEWITVAGAYHSGHEEFAALYRERVRLALGTKSIALPTNPAPSPVFRQTSGGVGLVWYATGAGKPLLTRSSGPLFDITKNDQQP